MNRPVDLRLFHGGLPRQAWIAILLTVTTLAGSGAAFGQSLGQGASDDISLWRVGAALFLCVMLAIGGAFVLKLRPDLGRFVALSTKRDRRLTLIETLRLSHQVDLCVVAFDGRELLLSASVQGVEVLERLPANLEGALQRQERVT